MPVHVYWVEMPAALLRSVGGQGQSNKRVQVPPVSEPVGPGFWQGTGGPVTWVPWAAQGPVGTRGGRSFDLT